MDKSIFVSIERDYPTKPIEWNVQVRWGGTFELGLYQSASSWILYTLFAGNGIDS